MKKENESEIPEADIEESAKQSADQLLRLKADFENTKKRLEREKQDSIRYANERLLAEVLPIMDDLDRAMASLKEGHDPEQVAKGLKLAQEAMHKVLERHGVTEIKGIGEDFDPNLHEAVGVVESTEEKEGTVVDEIQRGYLLNGRLIRPSRVRIAQKKLKGEA